MASFLYGVKTLNVATVELPVAATKTFYHQGHAFVTVDANGHVCPATAGDAKIFGYAIVPAGMGAGSSAATWVSASTSAVDRIQVVKASKGAQFIVPTTAAVVITQIGNACDIAGASLVDGGTSSTDVLVIDDIGTNWGGPAASALVRVNPVKEQSDT